MASLLQIQSPKLLQVLVLSRVPWISAFSVTIGLSIAGYLFTQAFLTKIPPIKGIPEAPGAVPFFGHLKALGSDHASKFQQWGVKHNWQVLQARLGRRRVLVLNGFREAQEWIVKNATATIDRPLFYTFHKVVSTSQGGTIGTSPWDESTKRRRVAVSTYLTRPALRNSAPMLDVESFAMIADMYSSTKKDKLGEVNPRLYCQRLAFNITLMICYGARFDDVGDPDLLNMLDIATTVSTFRSSNSNPQDYVPLLRYFPNNERQKLAVETREKRDIWLQNMLNRVQAVVEEDHYRPCITGSMLTESGSLNQADIKSINVSLVSGGFETVSTTMLAGLGWLASPEGQLLQDRIWDELLTVYGNISTAWEMVLTEEKSLVNVALYKEMLRHFAAIPLLPPRSTIKEFEWNGILIPKGITIYMNAQAINHDKSYYGEDADTFRPDRWLDEKHPIGSPYHFSFGAGSRACPAIAISNRIIYITVARLILLFRILPAADGSLLDTDYVNYNEDTTQQTAHPRPYKIRLEPRNSGGVDESSLETCFALSRANASTMEFN
ncbi:phenylacetate 2-hydroxylase [Thozetella sp. PMI_491]|nr:phenylacetate 2-hydroxylase [Thozetella sp. PMI_491]